MIKNFLMVLKYLQKTAAIQKGTGDLIGNKTADKITSA